jgi:hypothetical protein
LWRQSGYTAHGCDWTFVVDCNYYGDDQGQLHLYQDWPRPEVAAFIRGSEPRVNIWYEEQVCPPFLIAGLVHLFGVVPHDGFSPKVRQENPCNKENEVKYWGYSHILPCYVHAWVFDRDSLLHFAELKQSVCTKKPTEGKENISHNVRTTNCCEKPFLEKVIKHPSVNSLTKHLILWSNAQVTEEKGKEFEALNYVKLTVIPVFASRRDQAVPCLS